MIIRLLIITSVNNRYFNLVQKHFLSTLSCLEQTFPDRIQFTETRKRLFSYQINVLALSLLKQVRVSKSIYSSILSTFFDKRAACAQNQKSQRDFGFGCGQVTSHVSLIHCISFRICPGFKKGPFIYDKEIQCTDAGTFSTVKGILSRPLNPNKMFIYCQYVTNLN